MNDEIRQEEERQEEKVKVEDKEMFEVEKEQQQETKAEEETKEEKKIEISDEELKKLCQERICPDCPEKKSMMDQILRVKADADNFRKRMEREKEMFCKYATEKVLEDILPVIDNLELAIQHGKQVSECKDLVQGVEMTIKMLLDTLKKHGLEKIETKEGDRFDPAVHEALAEEEREDLETGMISKVMQGGYKIKDRVLRPARVFVAKKTNKN